MQRDNIEKKQSDAQARAKHNWNKKKQGKERDVFSKKHVQEIH